MNTKRTGTQSRFPSLITQVIVTTALVSARGIDTSSETASKAAASDAPEVVDSVPGDIVQVASSYPRAATFSMVSNSPITDNEVASNSPANLRLAMPMECLLAAPPVWRHHVAKQAI